jgi:hypothetical protein
MDRVDRLSVLRSVQTKCLSRVLGSWDNASRELNNSI